MLLRIAVLLGILGLAGGVWTAAFLIARTNRRAAREWPRLSGKVLSVSDPMRPSVVVERGIEFAPPLPPDVDPAIREPNERILQLESDQGLRHTTYYEFLIDPVTGKARVAGRLGLLWPLLLVLLGLAYLLFAGGFYLVTMPGEAAAGQWVYYQPPPWTEPAALSARYSAWPILEWALGALVSLFGAAYLWTSPIESLGKRAGMCSLVLFLAGVFVLLTLNRITYRLETDSAGLRESSALGWKMVPWAMLRGAVDETTRYYGRRDSRSLPLLNRVERRVFFTDPGGSELISVGDGLVPEQSQAILDQVLGRTRLQPEKRERSRNLLGHTS